MRSMGIVTIESLTGDATARTRRGWEVPVVKRLSFRASSKKDVAPISTAPSEPPLPPVSFFCAPKDEVGIDSDNKGGFAGKSGRGTDTDAKAFN
jgi:hypothetical protein